MPGFPAPAASHDELIAINALTSRATDPELDDCLDSPTPVAVEPLTHRREDLRQQHAAKRPPHDRLQPIIRRTRHPAPEQLGLAVRKPATTPSDSGAKPSPRGTPRGCIRISGCRHAPMSYTSRTTRTVQTSDAPRTLAVFSAGPRSRRPPRRNHLPCLRHTRNRRTAIALLGWRRSGPTAEPDRMVGAAARPV